MMYSLSCKDLGDDKCHFIATGEDKNMVVQKMMDHMSSAHEDKMQKMTEEMSMDEIKETFENKVKEADDEDEDMDE